jgi:hypothetical protein
VVHCYKHDKEFFPNLNDMNNMKNLVLSLLTAIFAVAAVSHSDAQIRTPQPSPLAELKQTIGLTDITVVYSRPGMKGRKVFGADGLVPYGRVWRTGANAATKITFGDDVMIGTNKLTKGTYALLSKPGEMSWEIHFFPFEAPGFGTYLEKTPVLVYQAKPERTASSTETFTIDFTNMTNASGDMVISWENTRVAVPIGVDVETKVMADINKVMGGPTAGEYYSAAVYYHDSGKDLNKALEWIQKSISMGSPRYWVVRREAMILGDLERYDEAIASATKSMDLAKEADDIDYVKMNEKSIAEWTEMKNKKKAKK